LSATTHARLGSGIMSDAALALWIAWIVVCAGLIFWAVIRGE
jgi:hypothetical protein